MGIQCFGKEGIFLNPNNLNNFLIVVIASTLLCCKHGTNKDDSVVINELKKEIRDSLYDYNSFDKQYVKKTYLNDSIVKFFRSVNKRNIYVEGIYDEKNNVKLGTWKLKYKDYYEEIEFAGRINERINQQKIFYMGKLDTIQSSFFTVDRKNGDLIFNFYEHKYTDSDSLIIRYSLNNKNFNEIYLKKEGFRTTYSLPINEKSDSIIFKAYILSAYKKGDYIFPREMFILDTI